MFINTDNFKQNETIFNEKGTKLKEFYGYNNRLSSKITSLLYTYYFGFLEKNVASLEFDQLFLFYNLLNNIYNDFLRLSRIFIDSLANDIKNNLFENNEHASFNLADELNNCLMIAFLQIGHCGENCSESFHKFRIDVEPKEKSEYELKLKLYELRLSAYDKALQFLRLKERNLRNRNEEAKIYFLIAKVYYFRFLIQGKDSDKQYYEKFFIDSKNVYSELINDPDINGNMLKKYIEKIDEILEIGNDRKKIVAFNKKTSMHKPSESIISNKGKVGSQKRKVAFFEGNEVLSNGMGLTEENQQTMQNENESEISQYVRRFLYTGNITS